MLASACGFFLSRPAGDPFWWTPVSFVLGAALAVAIGLRVADEDRLGTRLQRLLGAACLLLPVLRLATGGMDWAEALLARQTDVLTVDLLLLLAGAALLLARPRPRRGAAAAASWGRPSERPRDPRRDAVSLAALGYLAATDPKRRRAFRLPDPAPAPAGLGWAAVLLPGFCVPVWAGAAGFFVWPARARCSAGRSPRHRRTAPPRSAGRRTSCSSGSGSLEPLLRAGRAGGVPCGGPGDQRSSSACAS